MLTLKQIAARDDVDIHPKTASRWMKFFGIEPDQVGHGPNKYKHTTATRFVKLYNDYYKHRGTTPQITRAKYAGKLSDNNQLTLPLKLEAVRKIIAKKITIARRAVTKAKRK